MKTKLIALFFLLNHLVFANMASPYIDGSKNMCAFSSKDVDILGENIVIHINRYFGTAKFTIEYIIQSEVMGGQIPLLFYAKDYREGFQVWLDGKPIQVLNVPLDYYKTENTPFVDFSNTFNVVVDEFAYIPVHWKEDAVEKCHLNELKYFETDLPKGTHSIKVEYTADAWIYEGEWVNDYTYYYSLAPAKYWKSFGTLRMSIYQDGNSNYLNTNLGNPKEGQIGKVSTWEFNQLPVDLIEISYHPEINPLAENLITIEPFGLMCLVGVFLLIIHLVILLTSIRKNPLKRHTWLIVLGSIIATVLMIYSFFVSYDIIDFLIGEHASKRRGYYFLIIVVYPIILIIYLCLIFLANWIFKKFIFKKHLNANPLQ